MSHQRKALRTAVRAALTAAAIEGLTVRIAWAKPTSSDSLPDASVITPQTNHRDGSIGSQDHSTELAVVMRATSASPEDDLDDLALVVEPVVLAALTPLDYVLTASLRRTNFQPDGAFDKPRGEMQLFFVVEHFGPKGNPTT